MADIAMNTLLVPSRPPNSENGEEPPRAPWAASKSAHLYQVQGWGAPYFSVGADGHVKVTPRPDEDRAIDLFELTQDLRARGVDLPILIRFSDILADRIKQINECFGRAIRDCEYKATYQGVYPVKVNQQRHIVNEVVEFGRPWQFGLEAGSKPELLIALSAMNETGGLIICNGYKDPSYIETALIAQRFDKTVIVVLERLEELDYTLKAAEKLGISPMLGVRAKLSSKGMGRWGKSAGDRAKFGLSIPEIIEVVDKLKERGMLDTLRLLHFHIGSQISSIIPIKSALQEASNIYVELAKLGCRMGYLDVGGGLAIDYDGSQTDFHASKNYTLQEYASDVVATIQAACQKANIDEPTIVSESGRAVVSHQSVLVFDVVGVNQVKMPEPHPPEGQHGVLQVLYETYQGIMPKNVQESWHDASTAKEEAQSLFKYGYLGLRERAEAERLFWACCGKIERTLARLKFVPEELLDLIKQTSAIYYCNFSVFQSAPDAWAIDQLFPIMPIHRLNEEPTVRATLADLTCDSDGMIDHFIDVEDVKDTLSVHEFHKHEPYFLGMFLNGAYQEILGDLHNLFGDTNAVHVSLTDYGYRIDHVIKGDSMTEVLRYVAYSPEAMIDAVRTQAETALSRGKLTLVQMRVLMKHYEDAMNSYTYLSSDSEGS
jgi:arginine decarboxylase